MWLPMLTAKLSHAAARGTFTNGSEYRCIIHEAWYWWSDRHKQWYKCGPKHGHKSRLPDLTTDEWRISDC